MSNQAGKTDKVAQAYRTETWEKSKLWGNIEKKKQENKKDKARGKENDSSR